MDLELYRKLAGTYNVGSSRENAINQFVYQSDKIYNDTLSVYDVLSPSARGDDVVLTDFEKIDTEVRGVINYNRNLNEETMPTGLQRAYLPKDSSSVGDYLTIVRTGIKYLIESKNEDRFDFDDVYIRLAGDEIKWVDENGDIITALASKELLSEASTGIIEADVIRTLMAKLKIIVQKNSDSEKLKEGVRMFMGRHSYEISFIDDFTTSGLLNIYFKHDEYNKDTDDITNGLANVDDGNDDSPTNPW